MPPRPRRPEPSPALLRFRSSMMLDYDKWKDGEPYDIAALTQITLEEARQLADEIAAKGKLDWRDVEALRAIDTPRARARIKTAARLQTDGGGAEAFSEEVATHWSISAEKRLLAKLTRAQLMDSSLDRLLEMAEAHPTEAVRKRLWKLATTGEKDTRYTYGAFLLYLAGHAADWYGWNTRHRPHLLDITHETGGKQTAAIAWLKDKLDHPKVKKKARSTG
jgi:hypothetical protein